MTLSENFRDMFFLGGIGDINLSYRQLQGKSFFDSSDMNLHISVDHRLTPPTLLLCDIIQHKNLILIVMFNSVNKYVEMFPYFGQEEDTPVCCQG